MEIFDASGHRVRDLGTLPSTGGPADLSLSQIVLFADGTASVQLRPSDGAWSAPWNGVAADGSFVAAGVYTVRATYTAYAGGATAVKQGTLSVAPVSDHVGASMVAYPNPANGSRPMTLRWVPSARSSLIRGRVYNLAGELVYLRQVEAAAGSMDWELRSPNGANLADGIYIWDVEVRDSSNRVVERIIRKVVILRH